MLGKWTILWSLWAMRLVRQPTPEVLVESGLLRGSVSNTGAFISYLGIPYATVKRRFQTADPAPKWTGTFEAINEHVYCSQKWMFLDIVTGYEDCLILNVYTPVDVSATKLPVMVFIHGGGFFSGSASPFLYGPEFLVSRGVILVTFNYRLGLLGQLCLRTKAAPGNAAMKDQVAALKWVQRNIRAFNGNPDDVTIFGESAGGASVSLHVLSPMSRGLFHKAILQSGSSLAAWSHQYDPIQTASEVVKVLGFETNDHKVIYEILMDRSYRELLSVEIPIQEGSVALANNKLFSPCMEYNIDGEEAFLTELPYNLLSSGQYNDVPMIIGTTDEEGYFFMQFNRELPKIKFEKSLPSDLIFTDEKECNASANVFKKMYMNNDDMLSTHNLLKFSRFIGESHFTYPSAEETELILKNNHQPLYNYLFNYGGRRNMIKFILGEPFFSGPGAAHADDLFYIFSQLWLPILGEKEMIDRMTALWTNFAKYGNPTPNDDLGFRWKPTKPEDPTSLVLGSKQPYTRALWYSESMLYWKELYRKYRRRSD